MQDPNALGASTFAISPITALTQGVIASGICIGMLNMLSYVFRWGNNRHRRGRRQDWVVGSQPPGNQGHQTQDAQAEAPVEALAQQAVRRVLADWEEEQMQKEEEAEAWAEALDAERKAREDLPPTGMEYQEKRQMTFVGKLCCLFFPVIGLLAFCLCMEKRRVLVPKDGELVGLGDDDDNDNDDGDGGGDGGGGEGGKATPTHRQKLAEKGAAFVAHLRLDESVPKGAEAQRAAERLQLAFKRRQGRFELVRRAAEHAEALKYEQAVQRLQASYRGSKSRQTLKTLQAVTRLQRSMRRHLEAPSTDPSGSSSAGFIFGRIHLQPGSSSAAPPAPSGIHIVDIADDPPTTPPPSPPPSRVPLARRRDLPPRAAIAAAIAAAPTGAPLADQGGVLGALVPAVSHNHLDAFDAKDWKRSQGSPREAGQPEVQEGGVEGGTDAQEGRKGAEGRLPLEEHHGGGDRGAYRADDRRHRLAWGARILYPAHDRVDILCLRVPVLALCVLHIRAQVWRSHDRKGPPLVGHCLWMDVYDRRTLPGALPCLLAVSFQ